jgi:two-component system nitrogen regulation sensor histidine kinase NtrY
MRFGMKLRKPDRMRQTIRLAFYKHGYLLLTAAWLYTLSFIFTHYLSFNASPDRVKSTIETYLREKEEQIGNIESDTALLHSLFSEKGDEKKNEILNNDIGVFTYQVNDIGNPILIFWNTYIMMPNAADLYHKDGKYFVNYQNGSFELIKKTKRYRGDTYYFVSLIPVRWNYFKETEYLKTEFPAHTAIEESYKISDWKKGFAITTDESKPLFYLEKKTSTIPVKLDPVSTTFRIIAVIFLLLFLNAIANELLLNQGLSKSLLFLLPVLVGLRLLSYVLDFPFNYRQFELFDPSVYASSSFHPSLGDLLINTLLLFWLVVFSKFSLLRKNEYPRLCKKRMEIIGYGSIAVTVFAGFYAGRLIRSLVVDSSISFDVTDFFSLNIYTVISFVIISFILLAFYHLLHIAIILANAAKIHIANRLLTVTIAGLLFLSFSIGQPGTLMLASILLWIICCMVILYYRKEDIEKSLFRSSFFLFWTIFFAASAAALIIVQNREVEIAKQKKVAEKLALQTDPSGESLVNVAVSNLNDKFLSQNFARFHSEYSNRYIKDSIITENFSGYLSKYDTKVFTFDRFYAPLHNEDSVTYSVLQTAVRSQRKATDIPNLYYFESETDRFGFLYEKKVMANDSLLGYFYVLAKPRKYKSEALYPELFKEVDDAASDLNTNYAYAVYSREELITRFNDYDFPSRIQRRIVPRMEEFVVREHQGFNELWYNAGNNKVIVVVKNFSSFVEALTLFAYLFCTFLLVIVLFHMGSFLLRARFKWDVLKKMFELKIRTQIQATIVAISVFSFIVIGIATISFFIIRFDRSNRERLTKSIQVMALELESKLRSQLVFDDVMTLNDLGLAGDIEKKIIEIAEIHNMDINFYTVSGRLRVSTQPYIYNKHILSNLMEPNAYYELHHNNRIQWIQQENFNNFSYLSIYVPIRDETGTVVAYLNVPYLNSERELNQEISNFLVTLINLNAFIFVLAGAIALLVTNRITRSFSFIGNRMKEVGLGKTNEQIEWHRNDEIGALVTEYNKMVRQLEQSAATLARSEREGAWREMAKQVAHEIKNPLTPMKLSVQYLQKAVDADSDNVKELSQHVASTLIQQIDQLAKIASDFSQFANISNTKLEKFDVGDIVESLVTLYSADETLQIEMQKDEESYIIQADRTQINRLFTNLIKNAIEASSENEQKSIFIHVYNQMDTAVVSVKDNGSGIPEDMRNKIFVPNFTTKSSGTGLGLAICKGIVEKSNGAIWFETEEGKGTTFFVSLPIVEG